MRDRNHLNRSHSDTRWANQPFRECWRAEKSQFLPEIEPRLSIESVNDSVQAPKKQDLKYREYFNELDAFTALCFVATGASPAAKRTQILSMTQHA
jgi:hypothetical protein